MTTLNELKIKEHCNYNGYSYRYFGENAIITTNVDVWKLSTVRAREGKKIINKILVEHMNKVGNKSGKMRFHTQRYAYDMDYIFKNIIIPHQTYSRVYDKAFRIKKIFASL